MIKSGKLFMVAMGASLVLSGVVFAGAKEKQKSSGSNSPDVFYIYTERGSRLNHYTPSGWMGDFGDLKFNQGWKEGVEKPKVKGKKVDSGDGKDETCIQVKYTAERKQGAGWAGIYWQHPANNWGDKRGGFDLSPYSKMVFWAKGAKGGEVIDKFFIGGITGQTEDGDSDEASVSPVELTNEWKMYEIDLAGRDMSHIIGGFGFAANADANPNGFIAFVDEIKLVK